MWLLPQTHTLGPEVWGHLTGQPSHVSSQDWHCTRGGWHQRPSKNTLCILPLPSDGLPITSQQH